MTTELARDRPEGPVRGHPRGGVARRRRRILAGSIASRYDGLAVREISLVTLAVERPTRTTSSSPATPSRNGWPGD